MMIELIAILILAVAIAAVAWVWPRLRRPPRRSARSVRPPNSTRPAALGAAVPPASVSSLESARLRRELGERMNIQRHARKAPAAVNKAASPDDDGPVIGFAETMIQEDSKA